MVLVSKAQITEPAINGTANNRLIKKLIILFEPVSEVYLIRDDWQVIKKSGECKNIPRTAKTKRV
jgi:uncharacterized protein YggU (UPF0235/DUF167 family)